MTSEELKDLFTCDFSTGELRWRVPRGRHVRAGDIAGHEATDGKNIVFRRVTIAGKRYQVSRVIWALAYGAWPEGFIDHKDRNPLNNALENLRPATPSSNSGNRSRANTHANTFAGVSYRKDLGRYEARVGAGRKRKHLGFFDDPQEAHFVYLEQHVIEHGAFSPYLWQVVAI